MNKHRLRIFSGLLAGALILVSAGSLAADKQTVRAEVGKPLQAAQAALQGKQYKEALARISEAEAVGKLTPYESYVLNRMRGAAAIGAGDVSTGVSSFEAALASGQTPAAEQLTSIETLAKLTYSAKNFPKAIEYIQKYKAAGGTKADVANLLPQALYLGGKYKEAAQEISVQIGALEKAGQKPTETQLQLLASCALKQNDMSAYSASLERLVAYYPKNSYWLDLILRTAGKPDFSDRLSLDVARLRLKTGTMERAGDYMEATQLALQAGLPGEADQILKAGYEAKALGSGADLDRQNRLKDLVAKKVKEDQATLAEGEKAARAQPTGDGLVNTGLNYVGYKQYDKGVALMEEGIKKGQLKRPDEAKLHLGYAQLLAGKADAAQATFRTVQAKDGSRDLARLWSIRARSAAPAAVATKP